MRSPCRTLRLVVFLCANCKFITSSFAEIAFKSSASAAITFSPSNVLTGVSSTSYMAINISESGTDNPCSHFEMVCRTTFSLIASSCCESPFDFLIAFIFSLSIRNDLLPCGICENYRRNCPLLQATHFNIHWKRLFLLRYLIITRKNIQALLVRNVKENRKIYKLCGGRWIGLCLTGPVILK